jgi:hypothetical protein
MDRRRFGRPFYGDLDLDLCWDCRSIWFDQYESTQLSPASVIALFRLIHENRDKPARALADSMGCPHCEVRLLVTQDMQRSNRISYFRCPNGHGRLTTFIQFLREKEFIRSLSQPEIERLKATVSQVRCSSCGAVVDLARDSACPYCRSPISVLDDDAVGKTLAALAEADRKRTSPNAAEVAAAFEPLVASYRRPPRGSAWVRDFSLSQPTPPVVDLVLDGIGWLLK